MNSSFIKPGEEALFERIRNGDEKAADIILRRYEQEIYRALPNDIRHDSERKGDAMIAAWKALPNWNADSKLETFLYTVVRRNFLDHVNREKARNKKYGNPFSLDDTLDGETSTPFGETVSPDEVCEGACDGLIAMSNSAQYLSEIIDGNSELIEQNRAMQYTQLNPIQRNVLELALDGVKRKDIAEKLNMPLATVLTALHYAKKAVKDTFQIRRQAAKHLEKKDRSFLKVKKEEKEKRRKVLLLMLAEKEGCTPYELPMRTLTEWGFNPRVKKNLVSREMPKHELVNKYLPKDLRQQQWKYQFGNKWTKRRGKKNAFAALEEMVLTSHYIASITREGKYASIETIVECAFNNDTSATNESFFMKHLGYNRLEYNKIRLLAEITDNNSTIFRGTYTSAKQKLDTDIKILERIVEQTPLSINERTILEQYLQGKNGDQISTYTKSNTDLFPEPILPGKVKERYYYITQKIRVQAITMYQNEFERDTDQSQLKQETLAQYNSDGQLRMYDRYFRLRLQYILEDIFTANKWEESKIPTLATYGSLGKLHTALRVFGKSTMQLIQFAFPDRFKSWQFEYKNKWQGEEGRNNAFNALDFVYSQQNRVLITQQDVAQHATTNLIKPFNESLSDAITAYTCEFLAKRMGWDETQTNNYMLTRNLIALTCEYDMDLPRDKPYTAPSPEKIIGFDRSKWYQDAGLSGESIAEWELRLSLWRYDHFHVNHKEVSRQIGKGIKAITNKYGIERAQLQQCILASL